MGGRKIEEDEQATGGPAFDEASLHGASIFLLVHYNCTLLCINVYK